MILEILLAGAVLAFLTRKHKPRDHEPRATRLLPEPRPSRELTLSEIRIARRRTACVACGNELGMVEALRALGDMCPVCGRDRDRCQTAAELAARCRPMCVRCRFEPR